MRIKYCIAFLVQLFLITNAQSQNNVCFNTNMPSPILLSGSASGVASADLNGDSKTDVIVSNGTNLSVFLNTGAGNFSAPLNYYAGNYPGKIKVSDFNEDGFQDIISVNWGSNDISILLGTGTGTMNPPINYPVATNPYDVVCTDLNGDTHIDLALTNQSSNNTSVYFGNGTGTFSLSTSLSGSGPRSLVASDFNSDGKKDLAIVNLNVNNVSIYINNGSGGFTAATNYTVGSQSSEITCADFNGDGNFDLAVTNFSYDNKIYILNGLGNGSFANAVTYDAGGMASRDLISGDLNSDGNLDIVISNVYNISVLYGTGSGSFLSPVKYAGSAGYVTEADFDNDGFIDLIAANGSNPSSVKLYRGNGIGGFVLPNIVTGGQSPNSFIISDLNSDNKPDFVLSNANIDSITVIMNIGLGAFSSPVNYPGSGNSNGTGVLVSGDFNGDSKKDIAFANVATSSIITLTLKLGDGLGGFSSTSSYSLTTNNSAVGLTCADYNKDGKSDLAFAADGVTSISVFFGNASGTLGAPQVYTYGTTASLHGIHSADINNDGNIDIVSGLDIVNSKFITGLLGNGSGGFTNYSLTVPLYLEQIASGDFNNDGKIDLLTLQFNPPVISMFLGTGIGAFGPPTNFPLGGTLSIISIAVADFNNDGNLDFATSSLFEERVSIFSGNGTGAFSASADYFTGQRPAAILPFDYNKDGLADLAIMESMGYGNIGLLLNRTPSVKVAGPSCIGSTAVLQATKGANYYTWSPGNSSADTLLISSGGVYNVTMNYLNGSCSVNSASINVNTSQTCQDVWPGDANSDGTADNFDILELGLHFTQTGVARTTTNNSWQSYVCNNWTGTISNGKNVNHSDCNGDGTIDNNDTLAIFNNYGLTHAFKPAEQTVVNPQLSIIPDQTTVAKGNWGTSSVFLGEASAPVSNINGLAFTITFDQNLIDANSFYIEYPASFINAGNQNLKFSKPDFTNGKLYTATTHTITGNVNGNGKIAILHYRIKSTLATDGVLNIGISQSKQANANGVLTPLTAGTATVAAIGASVGMDELSSGNSIALYPNPATNSATIQSNTLLQKVEILSLTGQVILSETISGTQHQLDLTSIANGVYFVNIYSADQKVTRKKLVVQR